MQREIRLARERENDLRRSKGLPELPPIIPENSVDVVDSGRDSKVDSTVVGVGSGGYSSRTFNPSPQTDANIRSFASSRLQREIMEQKQREQKMRQEGHAISASEENVQPLNRYSEIVGQDSGAVKRNFKTPARRGSYTPTEDGSIAGDSDSIAPPTPRTGGPTTPREGKKGMGASGSAAFSYREFAQTAESKIERELREMREREEELR